MIEQRHTAEISTHYRRAFLEIAGYIAALEQKRGRSPASKAQQLAATIVDVARGYGVKGGWTGELNYAITMLIQLVPYEMQRRKAWEESLRYWIYAETVGALTRTAYDLHARTGDDYIGNGLAGVFEDIKDEYKRRVNSAYEAAQILKSGDCYDYVPFRTQLVAATSTAWPATRRSCCPDRIASHEAQRRLHSHGLRAEAVCSTRLSAVSARRSTRVISPTRR